MSRDNRNLPFFGQHLYTLVRLIKRGQMAARAQFIAGKMVTREERQLIRTIRAGNRAGCAELVRSHYASIYRFLLHLSGNVSSAEDLTQETFAAAWAGIGRFGGRASLKTWLHKIAYGKFVDAKRRCKVSQTAIEKLQRQNNSPAEARNPLAEAISKERSGRVYDAVGELNTDEREVIVLHYFQGLSFREMAAVLDEPTGTVKGRTSRALGQLKITLDGRV